MGGREAADSGLASAEVGRDDEDGAGVAASSSWDPPGKAEGGALCWDAEGGLAEVGREDPDRAIAADVGREEARDDGRDDWLSAISASARCASRDAFCCCHSAKASSYN